MQQMPLCFSFMSWNLTSSTIRVTVRCTRAHSVHHVLQEALGPSNQLLRKREGPGCIISAAKPVINACFWKLSRHSFVYVSSVRTVYGPGILLLKLKAQPPHAIPNPQYDICVPSRGSDQHTHTHACAHTHARRLSNTARMCSVFP